MAPSRLTKDKKPIDSSHVKKFVGRIGGPGGRLTKDKKPFDNAVSSIDTVKNGVEKFAQGLTTANKVVSGLKTNTDFGAQVVKHVGKAAGYATQASDTINKLASNPIVGTVAKYAKFAFEDPDPEKGKRKPGESFGQRLGRIAKRIGRKVGRGLKHAARDIVAGGIGLAAGGPAGAAAGVKIGESLLPLS
jgi:hypothetical protein